MRYGIRKFTPRMRILLIGCVVPVLASLTAASPASTTGRIVITGFEETSHLKLTVSGEDLLVSGFLDPGPQTGCSFTHGQNALTCPLAGVSRVELKMGDDADKVEVLDPLPVPLTVDLGEGSNKFIGNDEDDTCESGSGSDGCIGGGGDDTCIMGAGEDSCQGGPGNDRLDGEADSDHLSGGPGDDRISGGEASDKLAGESGTDTIAGGSGSDKAYGGPGNDSIYGEASPDKLYGQGGNDRLYGGPSPDKLYGQGGRDFCDGGPAVGQSHSCETGPGH